MVTYSLLPISIIRPGLNQVLVDKRPGDVAREEQVLSDPLVEVEGSQQRGYTSTQRFPHPSWSEGRLSDPTKNVYRVLGEGCTKICPGTVFVIIFAKNNVVF